MSGMDFSNDEEIRILTMSAFEDGKDEGQRKIVCCMKQKGMTEEEIAEMLDMSVEDVRELLSIK